MIKRLMFLGGLAAGFAVASGMTDEQRQAVRTKASRLTGGERSQRLASAVTDTTESVADAAVAKVETAADKVAAKVEPTHDSPGETSPTNGRNGSNGSNSSHAPRSAPPLGVV